MSATMLKGLHVTPEDQARFHEQIAGLKEKRDFAAMPGIGMAMWPEDVRFRDDLSERKRYNERFIEPDGITGQTAWIVYLYVGFHHFAFLICLIVGPLTQDYMSIWEGLAGYAFFLVCFGPVAAFGLFGAATGTRVRFNRQAQLVHIAVTKEPVHLPWRDVRPFTEFGKSLSGWHTLKLYFPVPAIKRKTLQEKDYELIYGKRPIELHGGMDERDWLSVDHNLMRLEFIRRYMEQGLDAVQPAPGVQATPPSGYSDPPANPGAFSRYVLKPILKLLYWLATGPLIDRWIAKKRAAFEWPEEVERLCAPGADLSGLGIDPTPVTPRSDLFYRFDHATRRVQYVDAAGQRVG